MVLNKSKWDHKAKVQYLRKHNLTRPKATAEVRPKWSGKKSQKQSALAWLDDDEWVSDDDALLNHFYPHLADHDVPLEHKKKFRRHILGLLQGAEEPAEAPEKERLEGIYLGNPENDREAGPSGGSDGHDSAYDASDEDDDAMVIPDLAAKLSDFALSDLTKNRSRKLLKAHMSDNLLEEYGLGSYSETVRDTDYEVPQKLNLDRLKAADLHGMRIGQARAKPQAEIRELSRDEQREHHERRKKLEHAAFHERIRSKFGAEQQKAKVLEINNFNAADEAQMSFLNGKLAQAPENGSDVDLDELLGITAPEEAAEPDVLDLLAAHPAPKATPDTPKKVKKPKTDDFLDDLLGI